MTKVTIPTWQERLGDGMAVLFTEQAKAMQAEIDDLRAALQAAPAQPVEMAAQVLAKDLAESGGMYSLIAADYAGQGYAVKVQKAEDYNASIAAQPVNQVLVEKAQAVVDRWETPLWKDAPATAGFIYDLRDAITQAQAQPAQGLTDGERYRWLRDSEWEMFMDSWLCEHHIYGEGPDQLDAAIDAVIRKGQQS